MSARVRPSPHCPVWRHYGHDQSPLALPLAGHVLRQNGPTTRPPLGDQVLQHQTLTTSVSARTEPRRVVAFACLVLGAVAMGASPIFVRLADVGPYASAFWRTV